MISDNEIVERILRRGDTSSFSLIVKRHSAMVLAKALSITHDEDLAADIAQDTFIKAFTQLDAWAGGASLAPWLSVIALHMAVNLMDKRRRRREQQITDDRADEEYSPDRERLLEQVRREVKALPPEDARMVRLFYYENMKTSDIARAMHLTEANVLVRLHRIRLKIRKHIDNDNNE